MSEIKAALMADIKACMKSGEKDRLAVLRLVSAAAKQREVDERIDLDDDAMIVILDKMAKQRRESMNSSRKVAAKTLQPLKKKNSKSSRHTCHNHLVTTKFNR